LDAQGNPTAVFIFQIGATLTNASSSNMSVINGAQPCNVLWQIGSSALRLRRSLAMSERFQS